MELTDRDYMARRNAGKRPFTAPPASQTANATKAMLLGFLVLIVLFRITGWMLEQHASAVEKKPAAMSTTTITNTPASNPGVKASHLPVAAPVARPAPTATATATARTAAQPDRAASARVIITKCTRNGRVSYGDGPCAPGAASTQVIIANPKQNFITPGPAQTSDATGRLKPP
jgi:hypothetical protein